MVAATAWGIGVTPARAADNPLLRYRRFWDYHLCMAIGDTGLRAPELAQRWNVVGGMEINARGNCVTAGYPPSRRFTIDTYSGSVDTCWRITSPDGWDFPEYSWNGNMARYVNNPVLRMNVNCFGAYRDHYVSAGIGSILGLAALNSTGYNSRVMNFTAWSIINVPQADVYSGALMEDLYNGEWG